MGPNRRRNKKGEEDVLKAVIKFQVQRQLAILAVVGRRRAGSPLDDILGKGRGDAALKVEVDVGGALGTTGAEEAHAVNLDIAWAVAEDKLDIRRRTRRDKTKKDGQGREEDVHVGWGKAPRQSWPEIFGAG
jgi:hypothetical protein